MHCFRKIVLYLNCVLLTVHGGPVSFLHRNTTRNELTRGDDSKFQRPFKETIFSSFDEVTVFLHKWFQRFRDMASPWDGNRQKSLNKRDTTPVIVKQNPGEPPFEEYERQFLIQRILESLTQIYYYARYLDPDSFPEDNDADKYASTTRIPDKPPTKPMLSNDRSISLLDLKRRQLELMSADELRNVFNSVSDSIQQGLANPVASLSSLCCPIG
ncbi:hypothetical protein ACJMK2_040354 [Sinanodonta woodiana]|uniref:Uncharacterized protein n=1 Tax=Sinanodonta woodiana TaxID=1069815 RepID=A0ABD3WEZ1_SINWO